MKYYEKQLPGRLTAKVQEFTGIHELTQYLNTTKYNQHYEREYKSSLEKGTLQSRWYGTEDYEEADKLFQTGWDKVAQRLAQRVKPATTTGPVQRSKPTYGLVGGQASVPRYIQGIPTNMVDRKPVVQKQKIIVINKDISFSASVKASEIEEEGVKALQIIQALENKGFRVKLNVYWATQHDDELISFRMVLKRPEDRLSLSKVAFPIAHPSMLRRIGFAWIERFPTMKNRGFIHGYGRPMGSRMHDVFEKGEIFLPNFIPDVDRFVEEIGKKL